MSSADSQNRGVGGRYGAGRQEATPAGIANEGDVAGRVGTTDVGGPSGNITGTRYDRNPRTAGEHTRRDASDLAHPEDFEGRPQHNEPVEHEWLGADGPLEEPLGAITSPVQHARTAMQAQGDVFRCPACGSEARFDGQDTGRRQAWCDGVNQALD